MFTSVVPSLSTKFTKISCQFSQYLGTKLNMVFEIAKSVEIVIILEKQLFYSEIVDFMQNTSLLLHLST